jgi:hypothetical protein
MVSPLLEPLLRRLARRRPRRGSAEPAPPAPQRLVSRPARVAGLATVAPETSVLLFPPGGGAQLYDPGTVLVPSLLPTSAPTYVVVTHRPVSLDLALGRLLTVDGQQLERVSLRLVVRVVSPPAGLLGLARTTGPDLEDELLRRLAAEVTSDVASAVRMNRLVDLRRLSLSGVLDDGWLSPSFVDGLISRVELQVLDVGWPTEADFFGLPPSPVTLAPAPTPASAPVSASVELAAPGSVR